MPTLTINGISIEVAPGTSAQVDVTMPASGTVHYFCKLHSGAGMQGSFVVTAAPSGAAASTTATTATTPTTVATTADDGYGY